MLIDQLVQVLGIFDPKQRLDAMVDLMASYQALTLPGHGAASSLTLEQWLDAAGAPRR